MFALMSRWVVQSWEDDYLEIDADDLIAQENGNLLFLTRGRLVLIIAHGTYQTAFDQDAGNIARRVAAPQILDLSRNGLAVVVDIKGQAE